MSPGYDRDLLAAKVNWEGGVTATLEYGLRSEDIADPDLRVQWQAMETLWAELRPLIVEFRRSLREPTPKAVVTLDNQSLLTSAHHRACIDHRHPPHAPCIGYDGAWSVHVLESE